MPDAPWVSPVTGAEGQKVEKQSQPESGAARQAAPTSAFRRRTIENADLFHGDRELVIIHYGHEDLLRITRKEKLILTK